MNPPVFELAFANADLKARLGSSPMRLFMFGEADQATPRPYVVWQTLYGAPENLLAGAPKDDVWSVQIDVYADRASDARSVAKDMRDTFETVAYVSSWNGEHRESDTRLYRYSFTLEFMTAR